MPTDFPDPPAFPALRDSTPLDVAPWRWFARLPGPLGFRTKTDDLFHCDLARLAAGGSPEVPGLAWHSRDRPVGPEAARFMRATIGLAAWWFWRRRIRRGECWLAIARLDGAPVHYTFVTIGGSGLRTFGPVMRQPAAVIGPCFTSDAARGRGIYPAVVAQALVRLRDHGTGHAYIHANATNEASLRGIRKNPAWQAVGRFLCVRYPLGRYVIAAADFARS
jgi:hypothetical protein